ncbi:MAG: demethoxyubiquinone hydroxylase family protein [Dongiaceae bacterium]
MKMTISDPAPSTLTIPLARADTAGNSEIARAIRNSIKVDHAGEYGAIAIYTAQILMARVFYRDLLPILREILAHERDHIRRFEILRIEYGARRCRVFPVWYVGGFALGLMTAALGRNGIRVCTYAVEDTVNRHLEKQIALMCIDAPRVADEIRSIQVQEAQHQHFGETGLKRGGVWRALEALVRGSTETVILASMRL